MKTIRISDAVWAKMVEHGKFGESADAVLRRLLDIDPPPAKLGHGQLQDPQRAGARRRRRSFSGPKVSPTVSDGQLRVAFTPGPERRWPLGDPNDRLLNQGVGDQAIEWAADHGARPGQLKAIRKALSDAGYRVRRRRQ